MDVRVTWWRRYGQNRLIVEDDDGRLGWHDLWTGETIIERPERAPEVYEALEDYFHERVPQMDKPREVVVTEVVRADVPTARSGQESADQPEGVS